MKEMRIPHLNGCNHVQLILIINTSSKETITFFKPVQFEYEDENVHQQQHSIVSQKIKESSRRPQI